MPPLPVIVPVGGGLASGCGEPESPPDEPQGGAGGQLGAGHDPASGGDWHRFVDVSHHQPP